MLRTCLLVTLVLACQSLLAQNPNDTNVKRVILRGSDGPETLYEVTCRDGTKLSVIEDSAKSNICAHPRGKSKICRTAWNVREAAAAACR